jgi:hypothetical protein
MEFDIGNILYIVITIVAVAAGLLRKKKKPAGGVSGASEGSARPGFFENLERVLQMGQEPAEPTELQEFEADMPVEEAVAAEVVDDPFVDIRNRPTIMEEYDRIMGRGKDGELDFMTEEGEQTNEELELFELDEIPGTNYFEIVRDFDAGTAVVYSTIINRLDY